MSLLMSSENGEVGEFGPVNPADEVQIIVDQMSESDKSQISTYINNFINTSSNFSSVSSFGEPNRDWTDSCLQKVFEHSKKDQKLSKSVLDYFIQVTLKDLNEQEWVCVNKKWAKENGEEITYWQREVCSKAA